MRLIGLAFMVLAVFVLAGYLATESVEAWRGRRSRDDNE